MIRLLALGVLLAPSVTQATGTCENQPRLYPSVKGFNEAKKSFAVEGTQAWCNERQRGGTIEEETGTLSFVEIRDHRGKLVERLGSATGKDAKRLRAMVGKFKYVEADKLDATLEARGFKPVGDSASSPNGRCVVQTVWTKTKADQNGFPAGTLFADVLADGKRVVRLRVGSVAEVLQKEVVLRTGYVRDGKSLAIWVRLPRCTGGPPPGYFGPDDAGECYQQDQSVVFLREAKKLKGLGPCFEAAE